MLSATQSVLAELESIALPTRTVEGHAAVDGQVFTERIETPATSQAVTHYFFVDVADAVLTLADGQRIYVRLVAHIASDHDLQPKQAEVPEIIIEIADPVLQGLGRAELRDYIALNTTGRVWCKNQALQLQAERLALQKAHAYDAGRLARRPLPPSPTSAASTEARPSSRPPTPKPTPYREPASFMWADGTARAEAQGVREWRRFYSDGAYRLYAPRVDYDKVLREAEDARAQGQPFVELLKTIDSEYGLGGDLQPITRVLWAAGLIKGG